MIKMKKKYAILSACGGPLHHESDTITDDMRHYIRVNPTSSIIQRSKARRAHHGFIYLNIN
jgi:hypothetical protein